MTALVAWPTYAERDQIVRALAGQDVERLTIEIPASSPWVLVTAWVHLEGERKLALWRQTLEVYEVGEDGAVREQPIALR